MESISHKWLLFPSEAIHQMILLYNKLVMAGNNLVIVQQGVN